MNKRPPADAGQPPWIRHAITGLGMAVVGHEAFIYDENVRWPLLLVAIIMMGLANADILDRFVPGPRSPDKDA